MLQRLLQSLEENGYLNMFVLGIIFIISIIGLIAAVAICRSANKSK